MKLNEAFVAQYFETAVLWMQHIQDDGWIQKQIVAAAQEMILTINAGSKILICGNGGSAADAQHVAGEMIGRFWRERSALPVIALTTDTSVLTAVANDYAFKHCFERQIQALIEPGRDALIALSTSGNSENINLAIALAKDLDARVIGLTGGSGGLMAKNKDCDVLIRVGCTQACHVQECHITILHAICAMVEAEYGDLDNPIGKM